MGYTAEDEALIREKWDDLLFSCTKICKNDEDWNFIKRAFFLAKEAHEGVRRRSGEPYLLHPIAVAKIVIDEIGLGVKSVVAALLHDVSKGTPGHALAGAGLMSQLGYPELAPLIAQHNDLEEPSRTDEAAVVFLADKLRRGAAPVRVTERFRESLSRCRDEEARRAHGRRLEAALESARRINDICGKDVVQI